MHADKKQKVKKGKCIGNNLMDDYLINYYYYLNIKVIHNLIHKK